MTQDGQRIENTLYFSKATGWNAGSATSILNDLLEWWTTSIKPLVHTSVIVRELVGTDLSSGTGFQVTVTPATILTGARTDEPMSNGQTLAISFRTANRGRSYRGRNYTVGWTIDQVFGNEVVQEHLDDYVAAYTMLRTTIAPDALATWVVVSRFSGVDGDGKPIPRVTGIATLITAVLFVDNIVDFQRRRLPTRGT